MYTKFYGFSHKPFELTPNPDVIFLSETHQEALSVLLYGVYNRKGFLQVSGDVGSGKSTLVQALISKLAKNIHLCHIPNPNFTVNEFYYYISAKFGLDKFDGNRAKFILNLAEFLKQCREKNEFVLLIIDEAQVLSLELLEEIRLLSNQEYTEFGVLSIFFVGQPELNILLKHKKMAPLRNRIGIRFNLDPLTLDETVAYIQFRLKKAGRTTLLFSSKAIDNIHELTGGIPRSINILCDNALLEGFAEQRGVIDEYIILDCANELEQPDVDSAPTENDTIGFEVKPAPISPKSVAQKVYHDNKKIKTNSLRKKLAFVFVIICALFFAMMFTTEYWGRLPGTEPAKAWFEKLHIDDTLFERIKGLFSARKDNIELNAAEKNIASEKGNASSVPQAEKNNAQNNPEITKKSIAEPDSQNIARNNVNTAIIETKQNPDENNFESNTSQISSELTVARLSGIDTAAEKLEIKKNADGTNYLSITRQAKSEPVIKTLIRDDAFTEPVKNELQSDETAYASITDQVGGANIRKDPSISDNILRAVSPGYPLRVISQYGDWSMVEDFKKRKGWIVTSLIIANNTVILKSDKVDLFKSPGHRDDIIAKIDYGTIMQVEERQDRWLKVQNKDSVIGWIDKDMVWP